MMEMRWVKRRVRRSSSSLESFFGSTVTPPFAPPNGMSMSAVFHVVIGVGVVANPPFAGTARAVVLDAVAGEHLDAAVVHPHRDLDLHLAERRYENAPHVVLEADEIGGAVELARDDGFPRHRGARRG